MIKESLTPGSKKMIKDLMKCKEEMLTNTDALIKSDDLEYSIGHLYTKGLMKTKKQLLEGNFQVCPLLTDKGSRILGKSGSLIKKLNTYHPTRKNYSIKKVHKNKREIGVNNSQGIKFKTRALGIILIIALKVKWNILDKFREL